MVRNEGNCGTGNVSYGGDRELLRGRLASDAADAVRPSDSCLSCERAGRLCDGFHDDVEVTDDFQNIGTRDSITTSNREGNA